MSTRDKQRNDSRAASDRNLPRLQASLIEIDRKRERMLRDLHECRHRAAQFTGAQRILREQASGIDLDAYLAGLDESLENEWDTESELQAKLVQLDAEKRAVVTAIKRLANPSERGILLG